MKKIYLVAIFIAIVSFSFAQRSERSVSNSIKMNKAGISNAKTPTDTLIPASCLTGAPVLYGASGGGYVSGNNSYGDLAKVQAFVNTSSIVVDGCLFWIGAKEIVGTPGTVAVNLYNMNGTGTTNVGTGQPCPGTILATVPKTMDVIDTGLSITNGLNAVNFTSPVIVPADFAIGIDFANIGNDTIGIVSTTDGNAGGTEFSWEKWSDGTWNSLLLPNASNGWGLDLDFYIFAVVDMSSANVNDSYFFDGIKLSCNPNPFISNSLIQYEIQNNGKVSMEIYDITGKLVATYNEGNQVAGKHNIVINSDKLQAGSYFYSLKCDSHRLTKKMIVTQ